MESHEQLEAWRMAHRLTLEVYQATDRWPRSERYELTTQARRAAISVPANIAEGVSRRGSREFRRFLDIARGSLAELSYLLVLARDRGLLEEREWVALDELRNEVGKLTWGLVRALRARIGQA
jgi:four helix bundle protein